MTALNKQALREMAERAGSDSWGYDRDEFNDAITPDVALALLDELEAKDATIAFQQHEIRTLLGRLENANRAAAAGKGATS
ncbi:ead/Ea22-like family protein [Escherichia coli]